MIAELPADTSGDELDGDEEPPPAEDYYEVGLDDYLDSLGEPAAEAVTAAPAPAVQPATGLAADWQTLFPDLKLGGLTASIAANCTLVAVDGDRWHLHLDPAQSALFNANQQRRLNDALNQQQGRPITLEVTIQTPEQETPAQAAARRRAERQRQAEQSIQDDPLIRQMMQQFAATVRAGTIEPVDTQA